MIHWYLGPYLWDETTDTQGGWVLPRRSISAIDLRPVGQAAEMGRPGAVSGRALIASRVEPAVMIPGYRHICDGGLDEPITARVAQIIDPSASDGTLYDAILTALTHSADPTGDAGPKPILPEVGMRLSVCCGGHRFHRRLERAGRAWANVLAVVRRDFDDLLANVASGTVAEEHSRKALDYSATKLELRGDEWRTLLSADALRDCKGLLPHSTTVTESFNKADSTVLGPDLTWTEVLADLAIASNSVFNDKATSGLGYGEARAEADVSGSDHDAQIELAYTWSAPGTSDNVRAMARFHPSARTHYLAIIGNNGGNGIRLGKRISGTFTELGSPAGSTGTTGDVLHCRCVGSTISAILNANSPTHSVTDTGISGNTRGGIGVQESGLLDNYQLADISVTQRYIKPQRRTLHEPAADYVW